MTMSRRAVLGVCSVLAFGASQASGRSLTIDDVLGMEHLDQASVSPDGNWIAAVIQRAAEGGEIYGRTAYETDPSRNDVWIVTRSTHERRNITEGAKSAAGFWCASWSPNGHRLAMLSTMPEGGEPRGGDNVRLYIWDRDTDRINRIGDVGLMTQTRYGGAIHHLDLRGGLDGGSATHACSAEENAPYLWLDNDRLLAVTLPKGKVSGLIEEAARGYAAEARDSQLLHDGSAPTSEAFGSGAARMPASAEEVGVIQTVDVNNQRWTVIATVPAYPFNGDLSIVVSPDRNRLAVMAPTSAFQPVAGRTFPYPWTQEWNIEKQLGMIDLRAGEPIRWSVLPRAAPYPLEFLAWSPDSRRFAVRSRSDPFEGTSSILVGDADARNIKVLGNALMNQPGAGTWSSHEPQFYWVNGQEMFARLSTADGSRLDWWRIGAHRAPTNMTTSWKLPPLSLRRLPDGKFAAIRDTAVVALDPRTGHTDELADVGSRGGSFVWPRDPSVDATKLVIGTSDAQQQQILHEVDLSKMLGPSVILPTTATPLSVSNGRLLWQFGDKTGLFLKETDLITAKADTLVSLDTMLADRAWGEVKFFDYRTLDGAAVKGAAVLPPDYKPGHRYPTLVWVYEMYSVSEHGDYYTDPQMSGFYNLQLYAAKGYVVLVPSMPLPPEGKRKLVYPVITNGVLPAIDKLIDLGIADADRIGVFGQSHGGYSVYSLLSQTNRFKAGVAIAGLTDLESAYGQFDPTARGYPGIAHEKSSNWFIVQQFGLPASPIGNHDAYWQDSPLAHVDHVQTPLLMLHGSNDIRGGIDEIERYFYALYAQGKTARLVRYGGETHSLAQSPANVRDIYHETVEWFDRYVRGVSPH